MPLPRDVFLFPFAEYWWFYLAFTAFVLCLLALDLGVFHKSAHAVSIKEASIWTVVWITLAMIFCTGLYFYCLHRFPQVDRLTALPGFIPEAAAKQTALEFLTGFVVEKALAVDNIFVFVVIFNFLAIPAKYQHRILFFGIIGALIFRIIFIALGSILLQYHWLIVLFGIFLLLTGIKVMFSPEKPLEPEKNPILNFLKKFFPLWPKIEGDTFFHRHERKMYATPLFVALCFIETSDIVFAVDSVPAIFAITREPLLVFTSNIFAILGLRAMYFLLAGIVHKFRFLKYGLGLVLIFVGLKMVWLNELFGGKFPIGLSLGIIVTVIGTAILASWFIPEKVESAA